MKKFALYESFQFIDDELLEQSEQNIPGKATIYPWKKWGAFAACCCLFIAAALNMTGLPGFSPSEKPQAGLAPNPSHSSSSILSEELPSADAGQPKKKVSDTALDQALTLSEALAVKPFGAYLPSSVPSGFITESLRWYQDKNNNYLSGVWTKGENSFDEISWKVYQYDALEAKRITSVDAIENYDLGLYPLPLADSVPDERFEIVEHPIFKIEELTLDAVNRRAYSLHHDHDTNSIHINFSVLYGDIVVQVITKGVSPEWLYEQLSQLNKDCA